MCVYIHSVCSFRSKSEYKEREERLRFLNQQERIRQEMRQSFMSEDSSSLSTNFHNDQSLYGFSGSALKASSKQRGQDESQHSQKYRNSTEVLELKQKLLQAADHIDRLKSMIKIQSQQGVDGNQGNQDFRAAANKQGSGGGRRGAVNDSATGTSVRGQFSLSSSTPVTRRSSVGPSNSDSAERRVEQLQLTVSRLQNVIKDLKSELSRVTNSDIQVLSEPSGTPLQIGLSRSISSPSLSGQSQSILTKESALQAENAQLKQLLEETRDQSEADSRTLEEMKSKFDALMMRYQSQHNDAQQISVGGNVRDDHASQPMGKRGSSSSNEIYAQKNIPKQPLSIQSSSRGSFRENLLLDTLHAMKSKYETFILSMKQTLFNTGSDVANLKKQFSEQLSTVCIEINDRVRTVSGDLAARGSDQIIKDSRIKLQRAHEKREKVLQLLILLFPLRPYGSRMAASSSALIIHTH